MRAKFVITAVITLVLIGVAIGSVSAHHGWSSYDSAKPLTIDGEVLKSSYGFPHASIVMAHEGKDWEIVLAPPSRMTSRGASEDDVAVGKTLAAFGYPASNGEPEMRAEHISFGGKTVQLR